MKAYIREPINGFTHLGGAILSFIGLLALFLIDSRIGIISGTIGFVATKLLNMLASIAFLPFKIFGV